MTNVYFLPAWGNSSIELLNSMKSQTPKESGQWKNIQGTADLFAADAFILQDYTTPEMEGFLKSNNLWDATYYFSREVPGGGPTKDYPQIPHQYSFLNQSSYLYTKWVYPNVTNGGISTSYDSLQEYAVSKSKNMLCVQSNKKFLEGHAIRIRFIENFCREAAGAFDLYGGIVQDSNFQSFKNREYLIANSKFLTSAPYRYCLAFDNGQYNNYFGTQFTDALLSWCVPVYWGAPNIGDFFPEDAYITFDAKNPDEIKRIVDLISDPSEYERRLPALKTARNLVLNKYNIWDTINEVVTTSKSTWGDF